MTHTTLIAAAALLLSTPMAFAQNYVEPDGAVIAPVVPFVVTGASGGTPDGTNADPATAFPRSAQTPGNSGLLGAETAEQHEKFGN